MTDPHVDAHVHADAHTRTHARHPRSFRHPALPGAPARRLLRAAVAAVAGLALLGACSSGAAQSGSAASGAGEPGSTPEGSRTLVVLAAASLKTAFPAIADEVFTPAHPDVTVTFSFAGSKDLVEQMAGGAPADVFASADAKNMDSAASQSLVGASTSFASNTLTLVTPADNPAGITGLDASLEGHKLVVCAEGVPCGNATAALSTKLGVTLSPVSEEQSVTDVLGKVTSGQADAGIVYVTDAASAGDKVRTVPIEGAESVVNDYRIAVTSSSRDAADAQAFLDAVSSAAGRDVLARYGFGAPLQ